MVTFVHNGHLFNLGTVLRKAHYLPLQNFKFFASSNFELMLLNFYFPLAFKFQISVNFFFALVRKSITRQSFFIRKVKAIKTNNRNISSISK